MEQTQALKLPQNASKSAAHSEADFKLLPLTPPSTPPLAASSASVKTQPSVGQQAVLSPTSPETPQVSEVHPEPFHVNQFSRMKSATIIVTLAVMSFLNTMGSSVLIGALPRIGVQHLGLCFSLLSILTVRFNNSSTTISYIVDMRVLLTG